MTIKENIEPFTYEDPFLLYKKFSNNQPSMMLESRSNNKAYARKNLVLPRQAIRIKGKGEEFFMEALTPVGEELFNFLAPAILDCADEGTYLSSNSIAGRVERRFDHLTATPTANLSTMLRTILSTVQSSYPFAGLHGAFAYDFARNFHEIDTRFSGADDFHLFVPSHIFYLDSEKETGEH